MGSARRADGQRGRARQSTATMGAVCTKSAAYREGEMETAGKTITVVSAAADSGMAMPPLAMDTAADSGGSTTEIKQRSESAEHPLTSRSSRRSELGASLRRRSLAPSTTRAAVVPSPRKVTFGKQATYNEGKNLTPAQVSQSARAQPTGGRL